MIERDVPLAASQPGVCEQLLSLACHDLRTPINAMVGWLHMLETGATPGSELFERARVGLVRAVQQQRELVEQLHEAARLIRGEHAVSHARLDAGALLARCLDAERGAAQPRRIVLELAPAAGDTTIDGDAAALERAVRLVIAALCRAYPQGTTLVGECAQHDARVAMRLHARGADPAAATATIQLLGALTAFGASTRRGPSGSRSVDVALAAMLLRANEVRTALAESGDGPVLELSFRVEPVVAASARGGPSADGR